MAEELYDGVFWLPSEFLTDDDLLMDFKTDRFMKNNSEDFTTGFGFNSDLSSPVDSLLGSIGTESDEDYSITGLTQKMANSSLHRPSFSFDETAKGLKMSDSPQSTLFLGQSGSDWGSPNSISRFSSSPESSDAVRMNLLYAEEANRRRMLAETTSFYTFGKTQVLQNRNSAIDFYGNEIKALISYRRQQQARLLQQKMNQQQQRMNSWVIENQFENVMRNGVAGRTPGAAGWPTVQPGSGMRGGFVGETGGVKKNQRTGTGVFIPRILGPESIEKPVQLPNRVIHALNLDSMEFPFQPRTTTNGNFTPDYDTALKHMALQHSRNLRVKMHQGMQIPSEWTY